MVPESRPTPPDASTSAILRLAWPLLFANLAVVGNGTIDAVMAGRLSADDMAGIAVASSIYITVYIGFMAVLQALSPIAGHHYGAHRWRAIGDDLQQALWLSGFLLLVALPCLLATGFWTRVAAVDGRVAGIVSTYLQAVAFGLPAALATRVFVSLNAAVSRPEGNHGHQSHRPLAQGAAQCGVHVRLGTHRADGWRRGRACPPRSLPGLRLG